ncbi:hypothetical protein SAMN02799631_00942 [Methylobacterium sp. 174MFSha1.1]|uniref:hypothetical protein n=1 Tax=Methylobacterium sp. 174MFSha1.1 TaxID=1502749 RepID=UPI0008E7B63C|nr:hypothetical protein [Methylobacterium sp. 174MFSha1.1]SFU49522.1 hypothetical protein SAMN02799631_00942 [Methylobacterium sp. 174MFSha1.1]
MTIYAKMVSVGLTIGLGGCLGLGQHAAPLSVAPAAVAYEDTFDPEPDPIPQATTAKQRFVEPSRVLAGTGIATPRPEATRTPRQKLAAIAPEGSAHIAVPAALPMALPTALAEGPSVLARVAAVQAIHQRNTEQARQRDQQNEKRVRRITSSICSGC